MPSGTRCWWTCRRCCARPSPSTSELFRSRGAVVTLKLCDTPRPLRADADRLIQVVVNLLSNAAKFVPEGEGHVDLSLQVDAQGVTVRVADNGPGVAAAQAESIFERFRQADGTDAQRPGNGTGLGLAISRQIVEHFGGRLWLEARSASGASFAFTLPWNNEETTP